MKGGDAVLDGEGGFVAEGEEEEDEEEEEEEKEEEEKELCCPIVLKCKSQRSRLCRIR